MLLFEILQDEEIVVIEPKAPLTPDDFRQLGREVDLYLEQHEKLRGVLVHAEALPGWDSLGGMINHLKFVRDHHRYVKRVALASDSKLSELVPKIAGHFVQAEVKHFDFDKKEEALEWLRNETESES